MGEHLRRTTLIAAAVIAIAGLSGCSALNRLDGAAPMHSGTASAGATTASAGRAAVSAGRAAAHHGGARASQHPTAPVAAPTDPAAAPIAPGTVVAETDVAAPDGSVGLHVRVVANDDKTFDAQISDYHSTRHEEMAVFFRQFDEQLGDKIEDGVSFGYENWGNPSVGPATPDADDSLGVAGVDPSFLKDVVIVPEDDANGTSPADFWTVIAVAPLHWSIPDRFPGLHVVDHGARSGATGAVQLQDGAPRFYTVAPGDTVRAIDARFGITVDELDYLTARQVDDFSDGAVPKSGELLNLSRALR